MSALDTLMEECGFQALVLSKTSAGAPVPQAKVCPGSCSGNGNCVDGGCTCAAGFEGSDCSVDSRQPPFVDEIIGSAFFSSFEGLYVVLWYF